MSNATEQIRILLAREGPISFARFMELALYCPLYGFYERKSDTVGKKGDFYTSVSVGPLFGKLLAFQFAEWWAEQPEREAGRGGLKIVEAGGHNGQLAADILTWMQRQRPKFFERVEYHLLEPSPERQNWQRETLRGFGAQVQWMERLPQTGATAERSSGSPFAIFFSNELLDAFPVHRLGWDAKARSWFEWGVKLEGENFAWVRLPEPPAVAILEAADLAFSPAPELLAVLPDGFIREVCPAAVNWWRAAAAWLPGGKLLTFDYGLEAEEFFSPQRTRGTLRAYHEHRLNDELLARAGEQDLTAHVNFTTIRQAGEASGLRTEGDTTQARFLTALAQRAWRESSGFGDWKPEDSRQLQTLMHPNHLGRTFRVLVQE